MFTANQKSNCHFHGNKATEDHVVYPTLTVITPLRPTLFMADEISSPILWSPLAEIVATLIRNSVIEHLYFTIQIQFV